MIRVTLVLFVLTYLTAGMSNESYAQNIAFDVSDCQPDPTEISEDGTRTNIKDYIFSHSCQILETYNTSDDSGLTKADVPGLFSFSQYSDNESESEYYEENCEDSEREFSTAVLKDVYESTISSQAYQTQGLCIAAKLEAYRASLSAIGKNGGVLCQLEQVGDDARNIRLRVLWNPEDWWINLEQGIRDEQLPRITDVKFLGLSCNSDSIISNSSFALIEGQKINTRSSQIDCRRETNKEVNISIDFSLRGYCDATMESIDLVDQVDWYLTADVSNREFRWPPHGDFYWPTEVSVCYQLAGNSTGDIGDRRIEIAFYDSSDQSEAITIDQHHPSCIERDDVSRLIISYPSGTIDYEIALQNGVFSSGHVKIVGTQ